ncbi:MAG: LysR family transcriptional regulator [Sphingomonadales bacterium]|nr:LysR family transcriptional regulator [Sphingomonadales bacterium]
MISLQVLRHATVLAEHAHYARAAEALGISQPALTRSIQALERRLGMRLFDRDRSGVRATPQGADFIARAAVVLANARDLEAMGAQMAQGIAGRLRFGMAPMPARALLADALLRRIAAAPALGNDVVVRAVEGLWPLLIAGEIEFFVSAEGQIPPLPPVRSEALGSFPYGLIVRAGHPLLAAGAADRSFPVLLSSSGHLPSGVDGVHLGERHVIEDFETLATLTAASDAIWVCSPHAVRRECDAGVLAELRRPAMHRPSMRIMFHSLDRRSPSPAALAMKGVLRARIRELHAGAAS